MKKHIYDIMLFMLAFGALSSCDDFLDRQPLSSVSPENYFTDESHVLAYTDEIYPRILSGDKTGYYGYEDVATDNQTGSDVHDRYYEGQWKVPHSGGNWSFETIYRCNYFFANVLPKFGEDLSGSQNTIGGNLQNIRHYIGEMYVLRALEYFNRYRKFGDFPIITEPLPDDREVLIETAKRMPRSEVARFILSDLDKAITLLGGTDKATTRINKDLALLIKSRVALFEGTWLKYFKGTAFVPNGEAWPGKNKDYNASYQFSSGSIDEEINWFLDQAMTASKEVAEKYKGQLTANTGTMQQDANETANPYYEMFAAENMSAYPEVLLWKQYALGISTNGIPLGANQGNWGTGLTRGYVQNYLMQDGLPVYAHGDYAEGDGKGYYMGDKTIADVRKNRDTRLSVFLKEPGQKNILVDGMSGVSDLFRTEPYPNILATSGQTLYVTGYAIRKGGGLDVKYFTDVYNGFTGWVQYRAAEALLNYMEASYERKGTLDASAREYWKLIRKRALVSEDIDATIAATHMAKEAENDWGAYSAGQVLSDATLYNIRRERRCEFLSEGLRYMDLCRWRAMDQMTVSPYIPEGMHLWNTPMEEWYEGEKIVADGSDAANMSSKSDSEYIRPYRKRTNQIGYGGLKWKMAHYLEPIMIKQFQLTAPDGQTIATSPLYQNPYWPTESDQPAEK